MIKNKYKIAIITFFIFLSLLFYVGKINDNHKSMTLKNFSYNKEFNIYFSYPEFQDIKTSISYENNGFSLNYNIGNTDKSRYYPPRLIFILNDDSNIKGMWKKSEKGILYIKKDETWPNYIYFKNKKDQIIKMEYNVVNGGFEELDGNNIIDVILSTIRD